MGKGKGAVDHYACIIRPGAIVFEMDRVSRTVALQVRCTARPLPSALLLGHSAAAGAPRPSRRRDAPGLPTPGALPRCCPPPPPLQALDSISYKCPFKVGFVEWN